MRNTRVEQAGRYKIRLRVQAVNPPKDGTVWCGMETGFGNSKDSALRWIGGFEATKKPAEYEFVAWIRAGHQLLVSPRDSALPQARRANGRIVGPAGDSEMKSVPGVAIKWIEMQRMDNVANEQSKQALIGGLEVNEREIISKNPKSDLQRLTHQFAQRAFRRPPFKPTARGLLQCCLLYTSPSPRDRG